MSDMSKTLDVSKLSRGWSKALAPQNIPRMLVTRDVFHLPMSSSKLAQAGLQPRLIQYDKSYAQKTNDMSVTCETSHALMGPYMAAAADGLAHHASRISSSAARSATKYPPGVAGGYGRWLGCGGGGLTRGPQSVQSVPRAQAVYSDPGPPSLHTPSDRQLLHPGQVSSHP